MRPLDPDDFISGIWHFFMYLIDGVWSLGKSKRDFNPAHIIHAMYGVRIHS
jgi:hypothetical protein